MKPDRLSELLRRGQALDKALRGLPARPGTAEPDPWPAFAKQVGDWLLECVAYGRSLPGGTPDRRALQGQVDYWTTRLRQADLPLDDIELLDDFDPSAGEPLPEADFPYFDLAAVTAELRHFGDQITPRFLGREDQTREYADHLSDDAHRALLIESESGGGKSSVAMAGVIPELMSLHGERWLFAPRLTPGVQPMQALHEALAAALGADMPIDWSPANVAKVLGPRCLLLFVDQLEELLTVCVDAQAQRQFSDWLAALAAAGPLRLLATLRSDHHDRLANSVSCRALYRLLTDNKSARLLPPLSFEQLRQVILRPAQAVGLRFVPAALVDRLANETANLPGGLPRLQFALRRLWDLRPPRDKPGQPKLDLIDQGAFDLLPSVSEALGRVAKQLLAGLPDAEQRAVQRLTLEMTVLDERSEAPLRRRRLQNELLAVLDRAKLATPAQALALIDKFVTARLLVRTGVGEACQVEVAHESLFRHWDDFQEWIKTDQARGRLKQVRQIARDAAEWEAKGRNADYLRLAGEPLAQALVFADEGWLDEASQRYCEASNHARQQQQQAEVWRRRQKWLLGVLGLVLMLGTVFAFYASRDGDRKRLAAAVNFASLIGQLDPLDALDLAYTLELKSPGAFTSPLAHAADRLEGSRLFGKPAQETDFSPSGRALVQRVPRPEPGMGKPGVEIWPVEDDGSWWDAPARVDIDPDPVHSEAPRLASVDVSPPLPAPEGEGKRHVLMTFFKSSSSGQGPNTFTTVALYEITRGGKTVSLLGEYEFVSDPPHELSEAAFNRQGVLLLSALRYPGPAQSTPPTHQLLSLKPAAGSNKLAPEILDTAAGDPANKENQRVVRAVAETDEALPDGKARLVTGRLDGTVFCGDKPLTRVDSSPITRLKVAGTWFVALHFSGRLVIGNCTQPETGLVGFHQGKSGVEQPRSLALLSAGQEHRLSFIDGQKLCELKWLTNEWPKVDDMKTCWAPGQDADQVMPVFASAEGRTRYWALPDRRRPWLVPMADKPVAPIRGEATVEANGLPLGQPADSSQSSGKAGGREGLPAAAGDQASAGIRTGDMGREVWRQLGKDAAKRVPVPTEGVKPGFVPTAVAVNARGDVAVLGSDGQLLVSPHGQGKPRVVAPAFRPLCMSLSAGGDQLLVSGQTGGRMRVRLTDTKTQGVVEEALAQDGQAGVSLGACAIADNGATVSGYQDGRVVYHGTQPAPRDEKRDLNPLVQFRISGGIQGLSIDSSGRFVAALGKSSQKSCPSGAGGRPLRIWDLNQGSAFPVASVCLPGRQIKTIGPLVRQRDGLWQLDVFEVDDQQKIKKWLYACLACGVSKVDLEKPMSSELSRRVHKFQPKKLGLGPLRDAYGIEP